MQRFHCYVDESGQDTKGKFFLVAVVLTEDDKCEAMEQGLLQVEESSGKRKVKWGSCRPERRLAYLDGIVQLRLPRGSFVYGVYPDTKEYGSLTTSTVVKALEMVAEGECRVSVVVDGLNKRELQKFTQGLRQHRVRYRDVRGMRDESSSFLRLADALAGFLRDYEEEQPYTRAMYQRLSARNLIMKLGE